MKLQELNYNLDIMQTTLLSGIEVDKGFLDIFADDFNRMASTLDANATATIQERIDRITILMENASTPVILPTQGARRYSKRFEDKTINKNVKRLTNYSFRKIRGDGHCLFRAIGAGILHNCVTNKSQRKQLKNTFRKYAKDFKPVYEELEKILNLQKDATTLLTNSYLNGHFVRLLRHIAAETIKNSDLAAFIEDDKPTDVYCEQIEAMHPALYGGNLEIQALGKALNLNIEVINVNDRKVKPKNYHRFINQQNSPEIHLLFSQAHYDLALPNK